MIRTAARDAYCTSGVWDYADCQDESSLSITQESQRRNTVAGLQLQPVLLYEDEIRSVEGPDVLRSGQSVRRAAKVTTATEITTVATVIASHTAMWSGWCGLLRASPLH
jgi:hypothetical protein